MAKIENLTNRDIEWIVVAVDAVAALLSSGLPKDNVRHGEWKDLASKLKAASRNLDSSEVFDDVSLWASVKPGDQVTIVVNGTTVMKEIMVYKDGAMVLLKKRTLDKLKEEGERQLAQKR